MKVGTCSACRLGKTVAVAAILSAGTSVSARAQIDIIPKVRLKAGIFFPRDSALRSASSDAWFKVGADVNLPFGFALIGGATRAGIEYTASGSNRIVPITLTQIFQPSAAVVRSPIYLGGGIGIWNVHLSGGGSASRIGFRVLGGIDITSKLFVEAEYDFVDKVSGVRAGGLSVMAGFKF